MVPPPAVSDSLSSRSPLPGASFEETSPMHAPVLLRTKLLLAKRGNAQAVVIKFK
jgi:hypothetical protein